MLALTASAALHWNYVVNDAVIWEIYKCRFRKPQRFSFQAEGVDVGVGLECVDGLSRAADAFKRDSSRPH
ncbi:MAG: hypothetical protein ACKERG_01055 [Candidatus Hodgkinia cicadicola]